MNQTPYIEQLLGRYVSIRVRSEQEVRTYLARKRKTISVSDELVEGLIEKLKSYGYIDDKKFAESVLHTMSGKGRGSAYVRARLQRAGIEKELITESLASRAPEQIKEAMQRRLEKSERKLAIVPQKECRFVAYRILAQSGFSSSEITSFLDEWCQKG